MSISKDLSIYKVSRRGKEPLATDEQKLFFMLPKDVPERTWADIMEKEENELMILDLREEILEIAVGIVYEKYMKRQTISFTAHCTADAILRLIDWNFYRHDPGEDPTATPLCFIPHRAESWVPDDIPDTSPKDVWGLQKLEVIEGSTCEEEQVSKWSSVDSLNYPYVKYIRKKYWFPGKVCYQDNQFEVLVDRRRQDSADSLGNASETLSDRVAAENEVLQKVIDYTQEPSMVQSQSLSSDLKGSDKYEENLIESSLKGAGDSALETPPKPSKAQSQRKSLEKCKSLSSKRQLATSLSLHRRLSGISDCRIRNLRVETQHEISSEKESTPVRDKFKKK